MSQKTVFGQTQPRALNYSTSVGLTDKLYLKHEIETETRPRILTTLLTEKLGLEQDPVYEEMCAELTT